MGGRAAEKLHFETISTGAEDDLKKATQLARKMVIDWGMSDELPNVSYGDEKQQVFLGEEIAHRRKYSEQTAKEIDRVVFRILNDAFERATMVLQENQKTLDELADQLLRDEEVSGNWVISLLDKRHDGKRENRRSA